MKVRFEGLNSRSEADELLLLRQKRIQLPDDPTLNPELVRKAEEAIRESLIDHGYVHAAVSSRVDKIDGLPVALTFVLNEGQRLGIAEIKFEGNRIFSSQELAERLREYLDKYEQSQTEYDSEILDYSLHNLANFVRSRGYLQATFSEPKKEVAGQGLIITIDVKEGSLYRVGAISIDGASAIATEGVRAKIDLRTGDIANGEALSKCLYEDLKKTYGDLGYIQYTAEVTPEFVTGSDGAGVINFKIDIDEGVRFKIRKLTFAGVDLPQQELRGLLLIREGSVFNQSLFEDSVKKLNETGLYEFVDADRDVDFRTSEEEGFMDLAIKLTKKGP